MVVKMSIIRPDCGNHSFFFCIRSLSVVRITAVGHHWGPVIPTSARIGSPGPGRFPCSHCVWLGAIMKPSDSDFGQNWKPRTGEIPLLSLWLGAIEAQWFRHRPVLEAQDRGDSPALWLGAIEAQWFRLRPGLEARDRGNSPTLFKWSHGAWIMGNSHTRWPLINTSQAAWHDWWTCGDKVIGYDWGSNSGSFWSWNKRPNHSTTDLHNPSQQKLQMNRCHPLHPWLSTSPEHTVNIR
jgi:hypothetical protein